MTDLTLIEELEFLRDDIEAIWLRLIDERGGLDRTVQGVAQAAHEVQKCIRWEEQQKDQGDEQESVSRR